MSKLIEQLNELAHHSKGFTPAQKAAELEVCADGVMYVKLDGRPLFIADNEAEAVAKLAQYLLTNHIPAIAA